MSVYYDDELPGIYRWLTLNCLFVIVSLNLTLYNGGCGINKMNISQPYEIATHQKNVSNYYFGFTSKLHITPVVH